MPFSAARPRQSAALPYSRYAIEWSESPATICAVRCPASEPEVGFWPAGSFGISTSVTFTVARSGVPSDENIVYVASTDCR